MAKSGTYKETEQEIKSALEINKTLGDKLSIFITNTFGSITFLCSCLIFFAIWITWNLGLFGLKPFDPYPFAALDMMVSLFAIILSVSVLISQNRQGRIEKVNKRVEFEVNVRAENEITKVLAMLHEIQKKMGIHVKDDELEEMKESIDLQKLHNKMDESTEKQKDIKLID